MEKKLAMESRTLITCLIYFTLLLDNILLTVIVPILPDYLASMDRNSSIVIPQRIIYKNFDLHYVPTILKHPVAGTQSIPKVEHPENKSNFNFESETGKVGILLSVKAFTQLLCNPFVGSLTNKFGYKLPIFFGTINLLLSSVIFAVGDSYWIYFLARAVQGVGSSCISICSMSLVAYMYPEEDKRSKIMGIILGSVALGVLLGYSIGGILYDFVGKSSPFFMLAGFLFINVLLQLTFFDFAAKSEVVSGNENVQEFKWLLLLSDNMILVITIAIWLSTSAMAILEPCLPIWLIAHLHPKKWQLGTVFIPDSLGYFIGSNFGYLTYRIGQVRASVMGLMLVGISCIIIPEAKQIANLIIPHFGLGLGIGVIDASLVPLLATIVDSKISDDISVTTGDSCSNNYGSVYAIQQTAVSLAYFVAPVLGSELVQSIGFPMLLRFLGVLNFIYGPFLLLITLKYNMKSTPTRQNDILLKDIGNVESSNYKKFYNSID